MTLQRAANPITVHLHGELKTEFGGPYTLHADSPPAANFSGSQRHLAGPKMAGLPLATTELMYYRPIRGQRLPGKRRRR
jgi:hypothetical protein